MNTFIQDIQTVLNRRVPFTFICSHLSVMLVLISIIALGIFFPSDAYAVQSGECLVIRNQSGLPICQSVDVGSLGFRIPTLADILTFAIRAFFAIAGIAALFYMLMGAFGWVTSGGDKDNITAARERIQAAVIGMILIVAVLAVIWTLEQVIFKRRICLGLTCPLSIPGLVDTAPNEKFCCSCATADGVIGDAIDAFQYRCNDQGKGELINPVIPH